MPFSQPVGVVHADQPPPNDLQILLIAADDTQPGAVMFDRVVRVIAPAGPK